MGYIPSQRAWTWLWYIHDASRWFVPLPRQKIWPLLTRVNLCRERRWDRSEDCWLRPGARRGWWEGRSCLRKRETRFGCNQAPPSFASIISFKSAFLLTTHRQLILLYLTPSHPYTTPTSLNKGVEKLSRTFPHSALPQPLHDPQFLRYLMRRQPSLQRPSHVHNTPLLASSSGLRVLGLQDNDSADFLTPLLGRETDD